MRVISLAVLVYFYGYYCDVCDKILTILCDKRIMKKKGLNKRLLVILSNLSNKNYIKWKKMEQKLILMLS